MIWLYWIFLIIADAWWNHWKEVKRMKEGKNILIFHGFEASYRIVAFGLFYWFGKVYQMDLVSQIGFGVGTFFSGWLILNIVLNLFNKQEIGYLGTKSILDHFEALCPSRAATMFFKLILACGGISMFYYGTLNPVG